MFEAHPYDTLVRGEKDLNEKYIKRIETTLCGKDTIRFAFISDTQRWYDETKDFVQSINKRQDIDFVLHGGDISDFGATHEFILQRDILLGLRMPWVALLGNHDCLGTGENVFNEIFGTPNFHFVAGKASEKGLQPDGSMAYETGDADRHWWVQAETVVGFLNLYQHFGDKEALQKALRCWDYIRRHLIHPKYGEWYWSIRADGTPNQQDDLAGFWKCPYHNSRMCLEIIERSFAIS